MKRMTLFFVIGAFASLISPHANSQDSREISKNLPLKASGELSIDTYKGSITVTTWDKPEVAIYARIEAEDEFDSDYAAEKVRETEVRIKGDDGHISIKTDYDGIRHHREGFWSFFNGDWGNLPSVHYTIQMPATASLTVKDYKSRSSIKNLRAALEFNTYKGDVEIADLDGSLNLETYKGEVRVTFSKMRDHSRCETYKGSITLTLPKSNGFDLDADLGRRTDFTSDFDVDFGRRSRHSNMRFAGPINGGGAQLVLRSSKGDIRLRQE